MRMETNDNGILAKLVAANVKAQRPNGDNAPCLKVVYLIDSIKRPEEIDVLKNIYGRGFYLFAVNSPEEQRLKFLEMDCNINSLDQRRDLLNRDQSEDSGHGQSTRESFHLADFFVSEIGEVNQLTSHLFRFLDIIFGSPFETPTFDEYAMFLAYAASTRSADLSRQVGAVVTMKNDVIATGANECPKAFGGSYWRVFDKSTNKYQDIALGRDYTRGHDPNARERERIIEKLGEGLDVDSLARVRENVKNSGINDLTEFGRIVHAEMDALLQCARQGTSCKDAELFCTTFPCHNCAKHLVASGIRRIVFVEPYPKSKALSLHEDSITTSNNDVTKVVFESFIGVGPRQFMNFFSMSLSIGGKMRRKSQGTSNKIEWDRNSARPRVKMFPSSYMENEEAARVSAMNSIESSGLSISGASSLVIS